MKLSGNNWIARACFCLLICTSQCTTFNVNRWSSNCHFTPTIKNVRPVTQSTPSIFDKTIISPSTMSPPPSAPLLPSTQSQVPQPQRGANEFFDSPESKPPEFTQLSYEEYLDLAIYIPPYTTLQQEKNLQEKQIDQQLQIESDLQLNYSIGFEVVSDYYIGPPGVTLNQQDQVYNNDTQQTYNSYSMLNTSEIESDVTDSYDSYSNNNSDSQQLQYDQSLIKNESYINETYDMDIMLSNESQSEYSDREKYSCEKTSELLKRLEFDIFFQGLATQDLLKMLDDQNSRFTIFVPSDLAFENFFQANVVSLNQFFQDKLLEKVLLYHIVPNGEFMLQDFQKNLVLPTLLEQADLYVDIFEQSTFILSMVSGFDGLIVYPDAQTCNAVVHVIDGVLLPDFDASGNLQFD